MQTPADRLKAARLEAGYSTAAEAARAIGIKEPTYSGHENGTTKLTRQAERYARFYRLSLDYLLEGKGARRLKQIPVVSYVGAGAEVFAIDDHSRGRGLKMVDPTVTYPDCVAAIIRGDSMLPLRDGWLIFWTRRQEGVPDECLGQLCIAQVKDGPVLLKEVRRGSKKGFFTLESWNARPREDVALEWASKIIDIRPA